ncbi:hypothetical protein QOZ40_28985, partial [Pseudomonas aeruginosa]|uniref:hypothetical protein n=1 Tax=Pseudomonas aeruginosa TaxID=287 RepID=UPI0034580704
ARVVNFYPNQVKTIYVADSMVEQQDNYVSIEESWSEFYNALMLGKKVLIDLTALRPSGSQNARRLTASGPLTFLRIYEAISDYVEQGTLTS